MCSGSGRRAIAALPANAQVLYGGLVGNAQDPQGAVLPGVAVSITNVGTGLKLDTVTDETGSYVFRNLLPGTYDMTLTLRGFKSPRLSKYSLKARNFSSKNSLCVRSSVVKSCMRFLICSVGVIPMKTNQSWNSKL